MALSNADASAAARSKGNDFYRQQKFTEAERAYTEAAELAPEDPAPLSNLSALYFEKGQYEDAVGNLRNALALSKDAPPAGPQIQKLLTRLAKACVLLRDLDGAREAIDKLADDASRAELRDALEATESLWTAYPDISVFRKQVLDRLSGFKTRLDDVAEYYAVGHDFATPLTDDDLLDTATGRGELALMFCGSGDARHVLSTLVDLGAREGFGKNPAFRNVHITLLDLKPASLARNLVFFDMVVQHTFTKLTKKRSDEEGMIDMAYLYAGAVLPPSVAARLRNHLDRLVKTLESDESVFNFMYLSPETRIQVARVMGQWQQGLPQFLSTNALRRAMRLRIRISKEAEARMFGRQQGPTYPGHEADQKTSDHLGVLLAPDSFIRRREPDLAPLVANYRSSSGEPADTRRLEEYIDAHWVPNFTLVDVDHSCRFALHAPRQEENPNLPEAVRAELRELVRVPSVEFDPLELVDRLESIPDLEPSDPGLLSKVGAKFDTFALALLQATVAKRLMFEMVAGEMTDFMERLRYGLLEYRTAKPPGDSEIDPTKFPSQYDRVHMSNIPDYIGGPLTTFLHTRPLLSEKAASNLRFNNLLNPPMFGSHKNFEAEYLLLDDPQQIARHFFVRRQPSDTVPDKPEMAAMLGIPPGESFIFENYFIWDRLPLKPLPWARRLPKPAFERWVYGHLLKVCVPFPRPLYSNQPVMAPLNLTIIPRLLAHAVNLGYPAHWISAIVAALCQGRITTTARAPRSLPVTAADLRRTYQPRSMSVAPFRAELTTLLAVWRRLMPCGLLAPLAPPGRARRYAVAFPAFDDLVAPHLPHLVLAFWDAAAVGGGGGDDDDEPPSGTDFRATLLDDEDSDRFFALEEAEGGAARRIRDTGLHILSAFRYATETRTAEFWLLEDVMEQMRKGDWVVNIVRTDSWEHVTARVGVAAVTELERWVDL